MSGRRTVPLVIAAKNEAANIGACVRSARQAAAFAEARWPVSIDVRVVCDDCEDETEALARAAGATTLRSSGGKVIAQRRGAAMKAPYYLFSDADVVLSEDALSALCGAMEVGPQVLAASVPRVPLRPVSSGLVAEAAYLYNLRRGFRTEPGWISGRMFAVRCYDVPGPAPACRDDRYLALERGVVAEDIYLSRSVLQRGGRAALVETTRGAVFFRPPETLRGLYRYYRRLRRELERTDALFPLLRALHVVRRVDTAALASAPRRERSLFRVFVATMRAFEVIYLVDRAYHRRVLRRSGAAWPVVEESKRQIVPSEIPGLPELPEDLRG